MKGVFIIIIYGFAILLVISWIHSIFEWFQSLFQSNETSSYPIQRSPPPLPINPLPRIQLPIIDTEILRYKNNWIENQQNSLLDYHGLMDLARNNDINSIGYRDLLNCFEWKFKRFKILHRDKFTCVDCSKKSYSLNVHHKYYLVNHLPWEIDDSGLVSLCRTCHSKRHNIENIKIYEIVENRKVESNNYFFRSCTRCQGTGYLPHFSHVEDGVCFLCNGNTIQRTIFSTKINYIVNNPTKYNTNELFDESFVFFDSITFDYFQNNILDKLTTRDSFEISEFFAPPPRRRTPQYAIDTTILGNGNDDLPF